MDERCDFCNRLPKLGEELTECEVCGAVFCPECGDMYAELCGDCLDEGEERDDD